MGEEGEEEEDSSFLITKAIRFSSFFKTQAFKKAHKKVIILLLKDFFQKENSVRDIL